MYNSASELFCSEVFLVLLLAILSPIKTLVSSAVF